MSDFAVKLSARLPEGFDNLAVTQSFQGIP